jgi:serine/threonine protein kinase
MSPTNQLETVGGRYRLGERIGHGGMGEVYAAQDLRLDREVALKLLRADLADQAAMRDRVLAEARLAARLTHPNVVAVLDTGEQDGRPFVVMERLSGRTLRDELAGGPFTGDRARDVGLQVLRALDAAHGLGIVHRDVKPGNVLDAGVGTWKVADFGIAKWLHADETLTGTGELLGSPSYLAPERIEGHDAGPASDLYAVGVLLYEALTGRRPYAGTDPISLATQITEGRYEPLSTVLPGVDPDLAAVVERAMRRDPSERFASAGEMAQALSGEATTAEVEPPVGVTRRAAVAPGADADGTATVELPRLDQTARLPAPRAAAPAPEGVGAPPPAAARRRWLAVAAAAITIALVTILAIAAFSGGPGTAPEGGGSSGLPTRLEDALRRLEEAVQP